jgi:putative ATPase
MLERANMDTDLFDAAGGSAHGEPLASRMRPRTLEEFVGQEHILGPGRLLRRAIQADQLSSLIFYGPPGTGKTTLARVIANTTASHFVSINAVLAGVKEIREATAEADSRRKHHGRRTILFVDEVHRWNKAQQDALLPWVENGTVVLIGATTENPYFEVNPALVSRSRIFQLKPLSPADLQSIAERTLKDPERGYGAYRVRIEPQALAHLVDVSGGDARTLLNALELAVETTPERFPPSPGATIRVTLAIAEESIQRRVVLYDKEGDYHFDTISAFIKSLRGSDPDAALYWLARMVYAGEDPRFLFRRMLIFASEDVGLADPMALAVAEAAAAAFDRVGLPEGRFHLAQAALYLATAPKSNSSLAFFDALSVVEKEQAGEVPSHLKDSSRDAEGFGHGEGYLYPHAYREHWVAQQYLPDRLQGRVFYQPSAQGAEARVRAEVERRREAQLAAMLEAESRPREVLTFSPGRKARDLWLERAVSNAGERLSAERERLFASLDLQRHHRVLVLNAGDGLLAWEALRRVPEGGVWALTLEQREAELLSARAQALPEMERPRVQAGSLAELPRLLARAGEEAVRFDAVVGRGALAREPDKAGALRLLAGLLSPGGRLSLAEVIPARGTHLSALLDLAGAPPGFVERLRQAEERVYRDPGDPLTAWDADDYEREAAGAGLQAVGAALEPHAGPRWIRPEDLERWLGESAGRGERGNYGGRLGLPAEDLERLRALAGAQLQGKEVSWIAVTLFLTAARPAGLRKGVGVG